MHPSTEFIPSVAEGLGPSGLVLALDAVEGWSLIEAFFGRVHPERCQGAQDGSFGFARLPVTAHGLRFTYRGRGPADPDILVRAAFDGLRVVLQPSLSRDSRPCLTESTLSSMAASS
jgi:hypothetical protein